MDDHSYFVQEKSQERELLSKKRKPQVLKRDGIKKIHINRLFYACQRHRNLKMSLFILEIRCDEAIRCTLITIGETFHE